MDKISSDASNLLKEWSRSQGVIFDQLADCRFSYFSLPNPSHFFQLRLMGRPIWLNQSLLIPIKLSRSATLLYTWFTTDVRICTYFCVREPRTIQKVSFSSTKIWLSQCRATFTALICSKRHAWSPICRWPTSMAYVLVPSSYYSVSYVHTSGSASASWYWWPSAVRLAISLETLCVCWRTYKFSSPMFSLLCLAFWTEFIKLLWRVVMSPVSKANYSTWHSQPSSRDYIQLEK